MSDVYFIIRISDDPPSPWVKVLRVTFVERK